MKKLLNKIAVLCAVLTAVQVTIVPYSARQELIAHATALSTEGYMVVIPTTLTFEKDDSDSGNYVANVKVSLEDVTLNTGSVSVGISDDNSNQLTLEEVVSSAPMPASTQTAYTSCNYSIKNNKEQAVNNGESILTVNAPVTNEMNYSVDLTLTVLESDVYYAGTYMGDLKFTVSTT